MKTKSIKLEFEEKKENKIEISDFKEMEINTSHTIKGVSDCGGCGAGCASCACGECGCSE